MRVSIIPEDGLIIVDGRPLSGFDLSILAGVHAIQWEGLVGEIEYKPVLVDGALQKPLNEVFDQIGQIQPYIDQWEAKRAIEDAPKVETPEETAARLGLEAWAVRLAQDQFEAKSYQKLKALASMSPSEIQTWMNSNITDLPSARDALTTMAIGLSVVVRKVFGKY